MKVMKIKWFKQQVGLLKSRIIYDYKPFNQQRMIHFYGNFIRSGDLCFDIGAHTGNRTSAWLKMRARVIAVEPQPLLIRLLEKKFQTNKNSIVVAMAVGSESGEGTLMISATNPAVSTLSDNWIRTIKDFEPSASWNERVKVHITTLDELIRNYGIPAFCKIDVEGYEEDVLEGLSQPLPSLSFEFFPTTPMRAINCINRLEELGKYKYNWSFTESFKLVSKTWMNRQEMGKAIMSYKGRKSGDIYAIMQ